MKKCTSCNYLKELKDFHKLKHGKFGVRSVCKECKKEKSRKYYLNNVEKFKEYGKKYYKNNSEERKKYTNKWRNNNKDKMKKIYKNESKRYKKDLQFRMRKVLRSRLRSALKGSFKSKKTLDYIGCTTMELIVHIESKFLDGMSWGNYGDWHIDHIYPLSKLDLTLENGIHKGCHYTNLQPLWAEDNIRKYNNVN